ncbi:MAG TPA: head-tail adaptor protein [Candidatus Anammoximicrobium sp.]|nr:head-tail adaptor protein [Candidatus Anammoximicrobium sp.]
MSIEEMIAGCGHKISVQRAVEARDALGGRTQSWFTVTVGVPAWVQDAAAALVESYARRGLQVTHRIYVAQDLELREGSRIVFGSRTFSVIGVTNAAGLDRLWQIDAKELL